MATPPPDESSFISSFKRLVAMEEHQAGQFAKLSKYFDGMLSSKPSHPDMPAEELQTMLRGMKRVTDAKERELRDKVDRGRQALTELSPYHLQELDEYFGSPEYEEKLNRTDQEIYKSADELCALERGVAVKAPQIIVSVDFIWINLASLLLTLKRTSKSFAATSRLSWPRWTRSPRRHPHHPATDRENTESRAECRGWAKAGKLNDASRDMLKAGLLGRQCERDHQGPLPYRQSELYWQVTWQRHQDFLEGGH